MTKVKRLEEGQKLIVVQYCGSSKEDPVESRYMELTTPFSAMLTAMRCRALTAKAVTANTLKKDAIYNGLSYALTDDCSRGYDLKSYIAEKVQLEESWIRNSYLFEIKFTVGAIAVTGGRFHINNGFVT